MTRSLLALVFPLALVGVLVGCASEIEPGSEESQTEKGPAVETNTAVPLVSTSKAPDKYDLAGACFMSCTHGRYKNTPEFCAHSCAID